MEFFRRFHWEIQSTMATRAQLEQFWVGKKGRIQSVSLKSYSSIWDHSRISVCMWHKQQTTFKAAFIEHNISLRSCTHQFVSDFAFIAGCSLLTQTHMNSHLSAQPLQSKMIFLLLLCNHAYMKRLILKSGQRRGLLVLTAASKFHSQAHYLPNIFDELLQKVCIDHTHTPTHTHPP